MIPIRTSIEDIDKIVEVSSKQVGWFPLAKLKQLLSSGGAGDDRKIATTVALDLLDRDGGNVRITSRGLKYSSGGKIEVLREALRSHPVYGPTLEWIHYGGLSEVTNVQIGQQWEQHHKDEVGDVTGQTLKDGATVFGRVAQGAGFGEFLIGRQGKETRLTVDSSALAGFMQESTPAEGQSSEAEGIAPRETSHGGAELEPSPTPVPPVSESLAPGANPRVSVTATPSVHVNVEIHIAADATADTVREIFKNMARYILDKEVADPDGH